MKKITLGVLLAAGVLLSLSRAGYSGQGVDPQAIRMMAVGDNIGLLFMFTGSGPHTLAFGSEDETIIVIDPKGPGTGATIIGKVHSGAEGRVTKLINTNAHRAASNGEYPDAIEIIAHENTKAAMAKMAAFKGPNAKFLPNKTFTDKMTFAVKSVGEKEGRSRIDLYYFGAGSTNGDTVVVFPSLDTVYMGDLFPGRSAPVIDTANGGSAVALPDTLDKAMVALKAEPGLKLVMPGRQLPPPGPYVPRWLGLRDLQEYADFNRAFLNAVKEAMKAGKSVAEATAELKLPEKFKDYGMEQAAANVKAIYDELKK